MKKDKNRTFYFVPATNDDGTPKILVASPDSPMWTKSFGSLSEAIDAVKARNKDAKNFVSKTNEVIAIYE